MAFSDSRFSLYYIDSLMNSTSSGESLEKELEYSRALGIQRIAEA
jgi:hypothetical protein